MNSRQLECFMTIVEENGIANAAKTLYVSKSALSQMVKKLEEELDTKLFTLNNRRLSLTYAGRQLYNFAQGISRDYKQLVNALSDADGTYSGELVVCLSVRRANSLMPILLPAYLEKYPDVRISIVGDIFTKQAREQHLLGGSCDFLIDDFPKNYYDRELECVEIGTEQMMLYLGKETALAKRVVIDGRPPDTISLEEIADEQLLLPPSGHGRRKMVDRMFAHIDRTPKTLAQISPISIGKSIVESGKFCTLSAECCRNGRPLVTQARNYYVIPISLEGEMGELASRPICIAYKKAIPLVTFQRKFIDMAIDLFSEPLE